LRTAACEAGASEYVIKESLLDLCNILRARSGATGAASREKGAKP
jgi:hypothetical protein